MAAQLIGRATGNGTGTFAPFTGQPKSDVLYVAGVFDGATVTILTRNNLILPGDNTPLGNYPVPVRNLSFTAPESCEVAFAAGQHLALQITNAGAATSIFVVVGV